MQELIKPYGTKMMAWGPLAQGRDGLFANPFLAIIGGKYGKSNAQVALRFLIQEGIIAIPKSTHIERMKENLDIFDFELDAEDMALIRLLDRGKGIVDFNDPKFAEMLFSFQAPSEK